MDSKSKHVANTIALRVGSYNQKQKRRENLAMQRKDEHVIYDTRVRSKILRSEFQFTFLPNMLRVVFAFLSIHAWLQHTTDSMLAALSVDRERLQRSTQLNRGRKAVIL